MKSTKREKNTATLSIVRSITNNCRRRFGRKRTNFRILSNRNVLNTLSPELPPLSSTNAWQISTTLDVQQKIFSSSLKFFRAVIPNLSIAKIFSDKLPINLTTQKFFSFAKLEIRVISKL